MKKSIKELDVIIKNYQEEIESLKCKIKEMSEGDEASFSVETFEEWQYSLIEMKKKLDIAEQERRVLKAGINYELELTGKLLSRSFMELQTIINVHTDEIRKLKRDVRRLKKVI